MRKLLFAFLLLLLSASSLFAQDWRGRRYERYRDNMVDLTPFIGYRYGGTIFADQSNLFSQDVDVKSSANFGLNLGIPINPYGMKIELLVDRQNTNFTHGGGLFSPSGNLGDFHVTYLQGGILMPFSESRGASPYMAVSAGVANLDPDINGVSASNRFSASAAIGVKVPLSRNMALRLEERGYFTSMQNNDRCRSCYYNYNHDLYQGETNLGLSFKF
jgi:opacity protein-like surface antigen